MYTMKAIITICIAAAALALTACSTVNTVAPMRAFGWDPRCQPRQYCPYTDPPPAIRTEQLRS